MNRSKNQPPTLSLPGIRLHLTLRALEKDGVGWETKGGGDHGPASITSGVLLPGRRQSFCQLVHLALSGLGGQSESWEKGKGGKSIWGGAGEREISYRDCLGESYETTSLGRRANRRRNDSKAEGK